MRGATGILVSIVAVAAGCGSSKLTPGMDAGGGAGGGGLDAPVEPDASADGPVGTDAVDAPAVVPLEHVTSTFPARDATGVCTDAPLRLFFDTPPMTGAGGWVRVFDAANPATPVDSFDIA